MEAYNRMLYDDMIKKTDVQYTIPVYQRNYTWEKEHCDQLYDDILNSVKQDKNHFIGSIVYSTTKKEDIKICPIIDGQQRLTTVMLLLKAIHESIEDKESLTYKKIEKHLYNELVIEERYKLKLKNTENDNNELEKVLMGVKNNLNENSKLVSNYKHFLSRVQKSVEEDNFTYEDLLSGIDRLEIVEIVLDEKDSPQKIFESINSTGVRLTTADLIRNFLLMGILDAGKQAEVYKKYWVGLEDLISKDNVEKFFLDYLILKDSRYIEEKKVYNNFKDYYLRQNPNREEDLEFIFEDILKYASYYKLIVNNDSNEFSGRANDHCKMFNLLQHKTINPFLLRVCEDFKDIKSLHDNSIFSNDEKYKLEQKQIEFEKILEFLGNYALRRNVSEIASSSLRGFYAFLYNRIFGKNKENLNNYYKSIESYLCTITTNDKIPSDTLFKEKLLRSNLYRKPSILRYFFDLIENQGAETHVMLDDLTIEHILPQTLSNEWRIELGENYQEIYDRYLHTLGNLSITGYNSDYSNLLFKEKKEKFNKYNEENKAKILNLNKELIYDNLNTWGEEEIINRGKRLSDIIMKKFNYPVDVDTTLKFEKHYHFNLIEPEDYADELADNPNFRLYGYSFEGTTYNLKSPSYKGIYIELLKKLYSKDNTLLDQMAEENYTYKYGTRILFSVDRKDENQTKIRDNLYVQINFSRREIFWWIRSFLEKYQIDLYDFSIIYTEKEERY